MRSFRNLFRLKKENCLDVIRVGNIKFIYVKFTSIKAVEAIINYSIIKDYMILFPDNVDDIYMINNEIYSLSSGFIIFYK